MTRIDKQDELGIISNSNLSASELIFPPSELSFPSSELIFPSLEPIYPSSQTIQYNSRQRDSQDTANQDNDEELCVCSIVMEAMPQALSVGTLQSSHTGGQGPQPAVQSNQYKAKRYHGCENSELI